MTAAEDTNLPSNQDDAEHSETHHGLRQCSERRHKGQRWLPEAEFRSKTGSRLLKTCRACRSLNHRDQNKYRAKKRAKATETSPKNTDSEAAEVKVHPDTQRCTATRHQDNDETVNVDTALTPTETLETNNVGTIPSSIEMPDTKDVPNTNEASSENEGTVPNSMEVLETEDVLDINEANSDNEGMTMLEDTTENKTAAGSLDMTEAGAGPGMRRCVSDEHQGPNQWMPDSSFLSPDGLDCAICQDCQARALQPTTRAQQRAERSGARPGTRFCEHPQHRGDFWVPEASFVTMLGTISKNCHICREMGHAQFRARWAKAKTLKCPEGMRRCAQGHFAPEDQFLSNPGRKTGSCKPCLDRRRKSDKLRREKKQAAKFGVRKTERQCQNCLKVLSNSMFDSNPNGSLQVNCSRCVGMLRKRRQIPVAIRQQLPTARYRNDKVDISRGGPNFERNAFVSQQTGHQHDITDGGGVHRDASSHGKGGLHSQPFESARDQEDLEDRQTATVPRRDVIEMARIISTHYVDDLKRDLDTYQIVSVEREAPNQLAIRLAKAVMSQSAFESDEVLDKILEDCRSLSNDELQWAYLGAMFPAWRSYLVDRILQDYFDEISGQINTKRTRTTNCRPSLVARARHNLHSQDKDNRGARRAVLSSRTGAPVANANQADRDPLADALFSTSFPNGHRTIPVSGQGFECGLRALISSLTSQMPEVSPPALDELRHIVLGGIARNNDSNGRDNADNFYVDQLAWGLRQWGLQRNEPVDLQLGYLLQDERAILVPGPTTAYTRTLWIQSDSDNGISENGDSMNHYSGVGKPFDADRTLFGDHEDSDHK